MSDVVIRAEGLGKKYTIGHETRRESYTALRDVIARGARNALRKARDMVHGRAIIEGDELEEVWALRDVSFEVRRGEVVGIIGRNGAGKSTLLKILSRITEPSEGRVSIKGRVASLLEVGTGFHPELTGRENIFLNGAILGMTRVEIKNKFDDIVGFAEVEKFLDTPVKRYSSGMYMRLAFAVAAHLDPEILVVDEVLAVGDITFQKKCLGKMGDVARQGRTILFVSHNMAAITNLCSRALWIDKGCISLSGDSSTVVDKYCASMPVTETSAPFSKKQRRFRSEDIEMTSFQTLDRNGEASDQYDAGETLRLRFVFKTSRDIPNLTLGFYITGMDGSRIIYGDSNPLHDFTLSVQAGEETNIECLIPQLWLTQGSYSIDAMISNGTSLECLEYVENAAHFIIIKCSPFGTGYNLSNKVVPVILPHTWIRVAQT